ncbi:ABC transporter permease [Faecalicatena orotica]|uniref:ABC transporter permease n=1 Tax=Faecalicatena orotica TaxID=1544 RepID=UPI003D2F1CA8
MMRHLNGRQRVLLGLTVSAVILLAVCIGGAFCGDAARVTDFSRKNLEPCLRYPFGTDWLGRDMLVRTLKGISLSVLLGMAAAAVSAFIALALGIAAATLGKTVDAVISFVIDLLMGIPHILLLILISVALGKGFRGVAWGVALTHWPSLARLIRAEVMQLKESPYIQIAGKLGKSRWYIAGKHILPHLMPQFLTGLVLLFPHAILHESSVTFLGFGLSSEQPAIGIILSESMKYLVTGKWWLALFPGTALVLVVVLFYVAGENLRKLTDPGSVHK